MSEHGNINQYLMRTCRKCLRTMYVGINIKNPGLKSQNSLLLKQIRDSGTQLAIEVYPTMTYCIVYENCILGPKSYASYIYEHIY